MNTEVKQQTAKDVQWKDESGMHVPFSRTTAAERFREKASYKIYQSALKLNSDLNAFKEGIMKASEYALELTMKENKTATKPRKGNFTWFNFDRSLKIEVNINERIAFDETLISLCKEKLQEFLDGNLTTTEEFVKELVNDAFHNTKGALDAKKVMNLLKYRSKIKDQRYQDAMDMLEKSIRKPDSKSYYKVWVKNPEGKYDYVDLNFSSL
jgi:hypothetical protein